jgi:hypothetical protein
MYSENLVVLLFMAAAQVSTLQTSAPSGPVVEDARHAMIRAVKEPELVVALSQRAKRIDARKQHTVPSQTLLASAD